MTGPVYLLHFDQPYKHARHYVGWTARNVKRRLAEHEAGRGARLLAVVREAIERLPGMRRQVITLRDVEGWSAKETCSLLGISEGNQRILLHRARLRVRAELECHFAGGRAPPSSTFERRHTANA